MGDEARNKNMTNRKTYNKMMIRGVRGTMTRFLAILCIVALGTGFLCGLLSTMPDMRVGVDRYFDEQNAMDFLIQGSQGINDENVEALKKEDCIEYAHGKYTLDLLMKDSEGESYVTRAIGEVFTDETSVNKVSLVDGRLPEKTGECVIEIPNMYAYEVKVGETLVIDETNMDYEDMLDTLKTDTFKVTGIVRSPQFIYAYGDSSTVGDGTMVMAMYVPEDTFDMDCYTAVYATAKNARDQQLYTEEYNSIIDDATKDLEDLGTVQAKARTDQIRADAMEEYNDGLKEFEEERDKALSELADAEAELKDGRAQIEYGRNQIAEGRQKIANSKAEIASGWDQIAEGRAKIADGRAQIEAGKEEIAANRKTIDEGLTQIEEGRATISENRETLAKGRQQIEEGRTQLVEGRETLAASKKQAEEGLKEIESGKTQLEQQYAVLEAQEAVLEENAELIEAMKAAAAAGQELTEEQLAMIAEYDAGVAACAEGRKALDQAKADLEAKETEVSEGLKEIEKQETLLNEAEAEIDKKEAEANAAEEALNEVEKDLDAKEAEAEAGLAAIEAAEQEITASETELASGESELNANEQLLLSAEEEVRKGEAEIRENEALLDEKEAELIAGEKEYEEAKAEAEKKISDAEKELADAKAEIDDIEDGKWIIRNRNDNPGMSGYKDDSAKIGAIAKIFPVFFFVIAALVALTTLTRLVDEERDKIGALKSLGYSGRDIMRYYMLYGLSASLLGCLIGIPFGCAFFPKVISNAYTMMYVLPRIATPVIPRVVIPVAGGLILMILLSVWFSTNEILKEKPAALLLPKAPRVGKRILLERVGFIWKHLSFSRKVTLRNIFRYKKRFLMTVVGVAGCFALLLTGFGIRDSISDIVELQYGEIMHHDYAAQVEDNETLSDKKLRSVLTDASLTSENLNVCEKYVTLKFNGESESSTLFIPQDPERLTDFVTLRDRRSHNPVEFRPGSAVLTEKSAENLGVRVGDTVTVTRGTSVKQDVTITGITENYVSSYFYMYPEDYRKIMGKDPDFTTIYLKTGPEGGDGELARKILESSGVFYIVDTETVRANFSDSVKSIDYIVYVLIVASGALAVIVLYNLTNVNICERKKELATIRVLGFYHKEVAAYIFREVDILAIIGILLGIPIGIWLHHYIVITVEVAGVMFGRTIGWSSYLIAAGLTILFTLAVNLIMRPVIRKIDMVESMKAVD